MCRDIGEGAPCRIEKSLIGVSESGEISLNRSGLVRWLGKDVGETSATEGGRYFGVNALGCTDRGMERTTAWEGGDEGGTALT